MTPSPLYLGNNGTIVYSGHAGFLVSTVGSVACLGSKVHLKRFRLSVALGIMGRCGKYGEILGAIA